MEYVVLKLLPIFLVYYCQYGETIPNEDNYLMFGNTIDQGSIIKTGDVMECQVTESKSQEYNKNDLHALTTSSIGYDFFYETSKTKKCFSFQLRTTVYPCLSLSETPLWAINGEHIEVILEYVGNIVLRKDFVHVSTTPFKDIVNRQDLRGFWIRWLDDQLIEVGRNTDHNPIVSYRLPRKLSIKYFSFLSYTDTAEWIIHDDPHCGAYNIPKKTQVESKCKVETTNNKVGTTLMLGNSFDQGSLIKFGDLLECEVTKVNSHEYNKNDLHALTTSSIGYDFFYETSKTKKCFSFQLRTTVYPCLSLSETPLWAINGEHIEVILEYVGNIVLRKDFVHVSTTPFKNIVNRQDLRGFWIRWLDDQLIEIGRNTDHNPIVSYRLPRKLSIKYFSFLSYTDTAEWIIHDDPHCGAYNIPKKTQVESKCKVVIPKVPTTTTKIPVTTTKIPVTTTKIPATTTKIPATTTKVPATTTKVPATTTRIPTTTTKAPTTTTNVPATTTKAAATTTKVPATTTSVPTTTTKAPTTTTNVPATTTKAAATTTKVPATTTEVNKITTTKVPENNKATTTKVNTENNKVTTTNQTMENSKVETTNVTAENSKVTTTNVNAENNKVETTKLNCENNNVLTTDQTVENSKVTTTNGTAENNKVTTTNITAENSKVTTTNVNAENNQFITKKLNCDVGTTDLNSEDQNILQKLQLHILNQINNRHRIFKANKLRSKEILLVYQQMIDKLFRNAEENQNKIYGEDNELYCPLKSITFNKITEEYLEFLSEIQMELASFKQVNSVNDSRGPDMDLRSSF